MKAEQHPARSGQHRKPHKPGWVRRIFDWIGDLLDLLEFWN